MPWFDTLDADHQAHLTSRGWEKLEPDAAAAEAVKAHLSATRLIGVPENMLVRLPKDAQDPTYQGVFDRVVGMATPKTADEYGFDGIKFKDGSDLHADDVKFVRELSAELKLTTAQSRAVAAKLADRATEFDDASVTGRAGQLASNIEALRQSWNAEYDAKAFAASEAGKAVGFTPAVLEFMGNLPTPEYIKNMNALVFLGAQMTEASVHRGGRESTDPSAGMNPEQARAELARMKADPEWGRKFLDQDPAAVARFNRVNERINAELRR